MTKNEILIALSASDRTKFGKEEFALQSFPQKVFSSIWEVESELNNGGFSQYFYNNIGDAAFVAEALDAIGAPKTAEICRRAIETAFPHGLPSTPEGISSIAAGFSDETLARMDRLDTEFFAYPHDLTSLLYAYVSRHPEEFGPLPQDTQNRGR
jgi:hypothetical protein